MDAEELQTLSNGTDGATNLPKSFTWTHQPLCFNLCDSKITSYVPISSNGPPIAIPFHTSDHLKALGLHVFERARGQRTHSSATEMEIGNDDDDSDKVMENSQVVDSSEEDWETESDAGTCDIEGFEEGDDVFCKETVKKKIDFLAQMAGVNSGGPAVVLTQVVRVLKELAKDTENMGAENVTTVLQTRMDKD